MRLATSLTQSLILSLIFVASSALADVREEKEYSYELNEGGRISLSNVNGDVTIEGTSGSQVIINVTKKAGKQEYLDELEIKIDATSDRIIIDTRHPDSDRGWFSWDDNNGSVRYELQVPYNVELDTIETVNGDIEISNVQGSVSAETVNGKMTLEGLQGDADLETVNGAIEAQFDVMGSGQRVGADAVNGRIVLRFPNDASAEIHAETLNGGIDADDFDLEAEKGFIGRDLDGSIGDGGARVSVDTVNGSITFESDS